MGPPLLDTWQAGQHSSIVFDAFARAIATSLAEGGATRYRTTALAQIAWAFAAADRPAPELFDDSFGELCEARDDWTEADLAMLHTWHLWRTQELNLPSLLTPAFEARCRDALIAQHTPDSGAASAGERRVVAALRPLGIEPRLHLATDAGHVLDVSVTWRGQQVHSSSP